MKKKKQEVILLNKAVSLDTFLSINNMNIFPLCIVLSESEKEEYNIDKDKSKFEVINDFYCRGFESLFIDSGELRHKIENGEVFVTTFIDKDEKIKHIDFIAPAIGLDLDDTKIVFRKSPRLFFKKTDHFSIDKKYEGQEFIHLCYEAVEDYQKKITRV